MFIDDHADCGIGVNDIAAALNVSPRSVQYLFRRHLGMTPVAYVRRVRLDRAHRDLQAANPAVDTVTAIAVRWGFTHAGRFSVAYKRAFGTATHSIVHRPVCDPLASSTRRVVHKSPRCRVLPKLG